MGKHSGKGGDSTPDTPEQAAAWLDNSFQTSQDNAEAKRKADPVGEMKRGLEIKGNGDNGRGGNIGISADGKTARHRGPRGK